MFYPRGLALLLHVQIKGWKSFFSSIINSFSERGEGEKFDEIINTLPSFIIFFYTAKEKQVFYVS